MWNRSILRGRSHTASPDARPETGLKPLKTLRISGFDALPLIEGGKGISVSNGESSGAWAAAGGVGTFSGVNPDSYDAQGHAVPQTATE